MQIDWVTSLAQIVNFLVLVFLLKRYLYQPILKAMDQREQRIADQWTEASRRAQEAAQERDLCQKRMAEFGELRQASLVQVRKEAEELRQELLAKAREEVENKRASWLGATERERELFVGNLGERVARMACSMTRRALGELSSRALEDCVVDRFALSLEKLGKSDRRAFVEAAASSKQPIDVSSSFEMPDALRQRLLEMVRQQLDENAELRFETTADLLCGLRLSSQGRTIAWNFEDYIADLEEELVDALG